MICPFCKSDKTKVEHTRAYDNVNFRWRRCDVCGRKFKTTEETISDEKTMSITEKPQNMG